MFNFSFNKCLESAMWFLARCIVVIVIDTILFDGSKKQE